MAAAYALSLLPWARKLGTLAGAFPQGSRQYGWDSALLGWLTSVPAQAAASKKVVTAGPRSAKQGSPSLFVTERQGLGGESDALY